MRYVGLNETFDAKAEATMRERIFVFSFKKEDYMLTHHIPWNVVLTEYEFNIGGYKYILPSGIYLFCGDGEGLYDWLRVDEIMDRQVRIFQMSSDFKNWHIASHKLVDSVVERVYMPQTKSVVPVADTNGQTFVLMSYSDPHREMKSFGFSNPFTV